MRDAVAVPLMEYRTVAVSVSARAVDELQASLDELAAEGFQVVTTIPAHGNRPLAVLLARQVGVRFVEVDMPAIAGVIATGQVPPGSPPGGGPAGLV
jgi:adenine/guanine phosphoribosyltransferase-like PRPP-binding protein